MKYSKNELSTKLDEIVSEYLDVIEQGANIGLSYKDKKRVPVNTLGLYCSKEEYKRYLNNKKQRLLAIIYSFLLLGVEPSLQYNKEYVSKMFYYRNPMGFINKSMYLL